jgi:hypothetical protein
MSLSSRKLLHVGCGTKRKDRTLPAFQSDEWEEVRFDIDTDVHPDIVGSMTDMSAVPTGSMDAIFTSHTVEHLYPHEVPITLAEFHRVLSADGVVIITCPDLQSVAKLVAEDRLLEAAYVSPAGPIAPIDILFGHRASMARGNLYMAHHGGFTRKALHAALRAAGFSSVATMARGRSPHFDLWALAAKVDLTEESLRSLAERYFPR